MVRSWPAHSQGRLLGPAITDKATTKRNRDAYEGAHRTAQPVPPFKAQQFAGPGRQQADAGLNQHALERRLYILPAP